MRKPIDVLLINPGDRKQIYQDLGDDFSAIEPPVFAGLFATYLRKKNASAAIIDAPAFSMPAAKVAEIAINEYRAKLVVIVVYGFQPSASTQNMTAAGAVAREIKLRDPSVRIMMTGTHPAAVPLQTMQEEAVDFVCDQEGPVTIFKTLRALDAQETEFTHIPSLWWRDGTNIEAPVKTEQLIKDLDSEMPGIAWDLLPMDRYRSHNWHAFDHIHERTPYAAIHTSLGCPYHCLFCCINAPFGNSSYRMWHPDTVVAEIDLLVNEYGIKNIKFVDEMFVLNERHVLGICDRLIERGYDLNIWAYARVDTIKPHLLEPMKKAGIRWLALGIESGSMHVRDGSSKVLKNNDIVGIVRMIQEAGIHVLGNFIFGLPDDTSATMRETLDLAKELQCEFANFYSAMAYPGSEFYARAIEEGWELPESWSGFSQHAYEALPLRTETLTASEVLEFRDSAFKEYFEDPAYLAMVEARFGADVCAHIDEMNSHSLKRKLLPDHPLPSLGTAG